MRRTCALCEQQPGSHLEDHHIQFERNDLYLASIASRQGDILPSLKIQP